MIKKVMYDRFGTPRIYIRCRKCHATVHESLHYCPICHKRIHNKEEE